MPIPCRFPGSASVDGEAHASEMTEKLHDGYRFYTRSRSSRGAGPSRRRALLRTLARRAVSDLAALAAALFDSTTSESSCAIWIRPEHIGVTGLASKLLARLMFKP